MRVNLIQLLNLETLKWTTVPFDLPHGFHSHNMLVWIDSTRKRLMASKIPGSLLIANLEINPKKSKEWETFQHRKSRQAKAALLSWTRETAVRLFMQCMEKPQFKLLTVFHGGEEYESQRVTWNRKHSAVQYPDVVAFPTSAKQVSQLVQCARRTGFWWIPPR